MSDWIFLSKGGDDQYIRLMAHGSGGRVTNSDDFVYEHSDRPIMMRGILKHKIMKRCWQDHRDFYYMDTGYFGNGRWKNWHRIVKNDLQHGDIVPRPPDRLQKLRLQWKPRQHGRVIIVAAPDEKPCRFYGIDQAEWLEQTVSLLSQHTDRPIQIRQRSPKKIDRTVHDPLWKVLERDVHALVTFNSVAAVESILCGVPAFVCAPSHAATPVANTDLSRINDPYWPDQDRLHAWACHLAYGQFNVAELRDGTAYRILNEH